jgi:acylglycerol lipase
LIVAGIARRLALSGYGVFAMDYPGFGLSEGLHGYIPSFDLLVQDVIEHYSNIKANPEFSSLPSFLFGQSMGGAVSLKIHLKQPNAWAGAVLLAPMCKVKTCFSLLLISGITNHNINMRYLFVLDCR